MLKERHMWIIFKLLGPFEEKVIANNFRGSIKDTYTKLDHIWTMLSRHMVTVIKKLHGTLYSFSYFMRIYRVLNGYISSYSCFTFAESPQAMFKANKMV